MIHVIMHDFREKTRDFMETKTSYKKLQLLRLNIWQNYNTRGAKSGNV